MAFSQSLILFPGSSRMRMGFYFSSPFTKKKARQCQKTDHPIINYQGTSDYLDSEQAGYSERTFGPKKSLEGHSHPGSRERPG